MLILKTCSAEQVFSLITMKRKYIQTAIFVILVLLLLNRCSLNRMVVGQMTPILQNSVDALYAERDPELAGQALPANLKLIEGLLETDPDNKALLLMTARGYAGYALGFLEDDQPQRAKNIYLRARDYALRVLRKDSDWQKVMSQSPDELKDLLETYGEDKVPALFWSGFAWAGYINLALDDPSALLALPKVEAIMNRVEALQPEYFHGAVYLFKGSVYGMKPRMMGGDPDKAKSCFEKNLELTAGKFLLTYFYLAKYYAAKTLDEALFDQYISQIEETPLDSAPEIALLNRIAKKKAALLKERKAEIF